MRSNNTNPEQQQQEQEHSNHTSDGRPNEQTAGDDAMGMKADNSNNNDSEVIASPLSLSSSSRRESANRLHQVVKTTVMAPVLAGKSVARTLTSAVSKRSVVKGMKKAANSNNMDHKNGKDSTQKMTQWEQGVQVIESLLQPESDTYQAMTLEQRQALKKVKKLLLKGPTTTHHQDDKTQYIPLDLIKEEKKRNSQQMKNHHRRASTRTSTAESSLVAAGVDTTTANRGGGGRRRHHAGSTISTARTRASASSVTSSFILQEYAGVRDTAALLLSTTLEISESEEDFLFDDDDLTESEEDFEVATAMTTPLSAVLGNNNNNVGLYFTPPEFTRLDQAEQQRLCEILSWDSISRWDFNIFELNELTSGQPLLFMGWAILGSPYAQASMALECGMADSSHTTDTEQAVRTLASSSSLAGYAFVDEFKIPPIKLCNYIRVIEQDYHAENPYHNAIHAADVIQSLHALIQISLRHDGDQEDGSLLQSCPNMKLFSILLAAVVHDVDHPGKTNAFYTKMRTEMAVMYNDASVLENWHIAHAFARMLDLDLSDANFQDSRVLSEAKKKMKNDPNSNDEGSEYNILCNVTPGDFATIRNLMIEAVLHTDMTRHFAMVSSAKGMLIQKGGCGCGSAGGPDTDEDDICWNVLMYMLHMADIANQAKPDPLFHLWTDRCMSEFFAQGDYEAELGLPISPNCDRQTTCKPDSQIGFIKFVVQPAYQVLGGLLPSVQQHVLPIIESNLEYWIRQSENEK